MEHSPRASRPGNRGFTAVELLIVVLVIGIVASIAIPTLRNAIDRGKQKRTMTDLRLIGTAIQAYHVDFSLYPNTSNLSMLAATLQPAYIRTLPTVDAWDHPLVYVGSAGTVYTIGSTGKDGGSSLTLNGSGGETHRFDDDLLYSRGMFVQWPEGLQE